VHGREKRSTENTGNSSHVEGVHQDVVLGLEYQHEVESSTDSKRHTIREGSLSDGVVEEDGGGSGNGGGESSEDPRTHAETVTELPLTSHVGSDSSQEMEDNKLVLSSVVEPLIKRGGFPDGVEMHSNSIGGRNDSTRDDVVSAAGIDKKCEPRSSSRMSISLPITYP